MQLILALLLLAPAAQAAPPTVHRCSATLTLPSGDVPVIGHGADEASARDRTRTWARLVAAYDVGWALWGASMWAPEQLQGRADAVFSSAELDASTLVPGATLGPVTCSTAKAPKGKGTWTATLRGETVTRTDAAAAVEAARRRVCLGEHAATRTQAFEGVARAAMEEKGGIWLAAGEASAAGLEACLSEEPALVAAKGKAPKNRGEVQCGRLVLRGRPPTLVPVSRAVGPNRDAARERAELEAVHHGLLQGVAGALQAAAQASPESKQTLIAASISTTMAPVMASELAERSLSVCSAAEPLEVVAWVPTDPEHLEDCSPVNTGWPHPAKTPDDAGVEALCTAEVLGGAPLIAEAWSKSLPEIRGMLGSSGWAVAWGCTAGCLADTNAAADGAWLPVDAPWPVDSAAATLALGRAAFVEQDVDKLLVAIPAFASPDMARRLPKAGDPSTWPPGEMVDQLLEQLAPSQSGGRWYLGPKPR